MEKAIQALAEAGYSKGLISAAEVKGRVNVIHRATEDGHYDHVISMEDDNDYDDYDDEDGYEGGFGDTIFSTVRIPVKAGQLVIADTDGVVMAYDADELAAKGLAFPRDTDGEIKSGITLYELAPSRVAGVTADGAFIYYDEETDEVVTAANSLVEHAYLDRDGRVVGTDRQSKAALYASLHDVAEELPFHPETFFRRLYIAYVDREDMPSFVRQELHELNATINVRAGADVEVVDYGNQRLTEECWNDAVASMPEEMQGYATDTMGLEGMVRAMSNDPRKADMLKAIRKIYAHLAPMPVEDFRMAPFASIAREMELRDDPDFTSRSELMDELIEQGGREIEISEDLQKVVETVYQKADMRIVEIGDMRTLVVFDDTTANMYFYPANPVLEERQDLDLDEGYGSGYGM